jgi:hypothetical protein
LLTGLTDNNEKYLERQMKYRRKESGARAPKHDDDGRNFSSERFHLREKAKFTLTLVAGDILSE